MTETVQRFLLTGLLALSAGATMAQPTVVDLRGGTANWFERTQRLGDSWLTLGETSLLFALNTSTQELTLHRIDQEGEKIERIASFCPLKAQSQPFEVLWRKEDRAVLAIRCDRRSAIWVTDGTAAGTQVLVAESAGLAGVLPGDRLVLWVDSAVGPELWVTDTTPSGTERLQAGFTSRSGVAFPEWRESEPVLPFVVFWAPHPSLGIGLWRTDGTVEGTRWVSVPLPGSQELEITQVGRVGDRYWFTSDTPGARGLWVSDGTSGGTRRVLESLESGPHFSRTMPYEAGPTKTFFFAESGPSIVNPRPDWWVTDGTPAGTLRLTRSLEGEVRADFGEYDAWRDSLYFFFAEVSGGISTLWRSDGTRAGTGPARETPLLLPNTQGPDLLRTPFGLLVVAAENVSDASALWIVDDAGSTPRKVASGGWNLRLPATAEFCYLTANAGFTGEPTDLWRTDGTLEGTKKLATKVLNEFPVMSVSPSGRALWLLGAELFGGPEERELWQSDGSANGTRRLSFPDLEVPLGTSPRHLVPSGERVAFMLDDPSVDDDSGNPLFGTALFESDGTPEGTVDLIDFPLGPLAPKHRLALLTPLPNGRVLFHVDNFSSAQTPFEGFWSANGQRGGTFKVSAPGEYGGGTSREFWPATDGALVGSRFSQGDERPEGLYRLFVDGRPPLPLWLEEDRFTFGARFLFLGPSLHALAKGRLFRTDGTPAGTSVAFHQPSVNWFIQHQGKLIFTDGLGQVWSYDGQSPPVHFAGDLGLLVNQIVVSTGGGIFGSIAGRLLFFDGATTREVARFSGVHSMAAFDGGLAFVAEPDRGDAELWFSDGSAAGTRRIADLWRGRLGSYPGDLLAVGDRLFFTAHDGSHGRELWSTDGTATGTVMYDINPGIGSSFPADLAVAGRRLFFSAYDDSHGRELWSLDLGEDFAPPVPSDAWLSSPAIPGFRFQVRLAGGTTGRLEPTCLSETACVSGAVAGRPEIFLRVVGPRGNGFLWPTLVKFTTSEVEIWLEQIATGRIRYYNLAGARPGVDELPARFDRLGFRPASATAPAVVAALAATAAPDAPLGGGPPPPAGTSFFESPVLPGFRVAVRITAGETQPPVRREAACIAETLCVSGAVPGRSEVFVRVVGPKPNGFLWPTLARFTSSQVEVWIEQKTTGLRQYYLLPGASADSDDLTGLFDRQGFVP